MEPKQLRLLLIVGIAAMVISVVCFIGVSSLVQSINEHKARTDQADAVVGDLTWDEILAAGNTDDEDDEASETPGPSPSGSAAAVAETTESAPASAGTEPSESASGAATRSAAPSASRSAGPSASPTASASASATPTLSPGSRPTVLAGGGLVPYDDRKFDITGYAVPEAGFMKVITITREGQTMRAQDISWEVDVSDSDDVHITMKGERLSDKDTIGTGALVELYDGDGVIDTAVVVLPGDVTGTGSVDASQLAVLQRALTDPDLLQGAYFLAGDLDGSGRIDAKDVALLRERISED